MAMSRSKPVLVPLSGGGEVLEFEIHHLGERLWAGL